MAAALGRPWVMTADSSATTALPVLSARSTSGATVNAATLGSYVGIFIGPAGVAELVQAHGLGPCGASHEGSSPSARKYSAMRSGCTSRDQPSNNGKALGESLGIPEDA